MFAAFNTYGWLIISLPILYWIGRIYQQQKQQKHQTFLFKNNENQKINLQIWALKVILVFSGLSFILLAVWRPQWGQGIEKIEKKGLDIVFTVDVSKSMKALDFSQDRTFISRLDATKYLIKNFVKKRSSDRIGLVEFAGESFVASPLTLDHTVFSNFLKNISSQDLGKQGTNLAEALEVSIARLEVQSTEKRGKAILLFSDGDETISSGAKKMAELAKLKGIKIFSVGVGSEKGQPIPEGQNAFGEIIYKQWKGETVLTALNAQPLRKIANISKGEYFHAANIGDLEKLQKSLQTLPKKILGEEQITPATEQYFGFAFVGLFLFSSGFLLPLTFFSKK